MTLYLDTETTGLRPPEDDLVEVALVDDHGRRL
jgi:DNA polymerase III epsilon subunit-like protein